MSPLHIFIFGLILPILFAKNQRNYFTQSIYDLWSQENLLASSLFLYPDRIPAGIHRRSDIKSVVYHLIDKDNHGLFTVQCKRVADFYFFILNITRPLDINREYQDIYRFSIQADIITNQENIIEQAEIHLHVADANDNDGVFDMDVYEKSFSQPWEIPQVLFRFHASDADEIHHAQILYEFSSSSLNELFSLHPLTGEFYLISNTNLQSTYEFDIYAYDRHRKDLINDNIKAKAHVILKFSDNETFHRIQTIRNETIEFKEMIFSYEISFLQNSNWNLLNLHQAILTIEISPPFISSSFEIFILNNSSFNTMNLFLEQNQIYLTDHRFQEYNLQFLICFFNRTKCQRTNYDLIPSIDLNAYQFHLISIEPISLEENLPIHSFITHIQLEYNEIYSDQELLIHYKLFNHQNQFILHPKTGILRLNQPLTYRNYSLDIRVDISLFNQFFSINQTIEIHVYEINKHPPIFSNHTFFPFPYQFQAIDFDDNHQTNSRLTYRLWNCSNPCIFEIHPHTGLFNLRKNENSIPMKKIYHLQIIAFDHGQPISFETKLDLTIDLSTKSIQRNLESKNNHSKIIHLNIGFREKTASYHLPEDTSLYRIIEFLKIEYDSFPFDINHENDHAFFYLINDTSIPFVIDQNQRTIQLIHHLDREKQDKYIFEVEFRLKSSYDIYQLSNNQIWHFRQSKKYYQKKLFTIYIDDINDHIPRCHHVHQHILLNENQIQTNLFHVQAYDLDRGENSTIVYSLLNYQQYFNIHSYTGQINVIQSIDHEQISSLHLHILASDQGNQPQLQSLCMTLHITIMDINDHVPQFSMMNYTFELFSDLPRNAIVGQIYAIDLDPTDQLIYSIEINPYITINNHTGHLRLKSTFDQLISQHFNLTVRIFDGLHINQTSIDFHLKSFPEAQQPILLSQPVYPIIINQSSSIGTIITNIYQHLELRISSIDSIEIISDDNPIPFSLDQQGSIRLIDSLINSSYWLSIRLTRYRAYPPHSFFHIHLTIHEDNFYLPQCVNIYQTIKFYPYSIPYPLVRVQAISLYDHIALEYHLIDETIFSIDQQTGVMQFLPSNQSKFLLTIRAFDKQHQLSVDCFLKIHSIQRAQLIPKFYHPSMYYVDIIEIPPNSERLRQRLFQIIALLDHDIYNHNLQIRYRISDSQQNFLINPQTGYIAAKKPLKSMHIYRLNVEAYTIAYTDKWRIVSSRVVLNIKVRVLPMNIHQPSLVLTDESIINLDLLTTTKVGSKLLQLGMNNNNNNQTKWFLLTSQIEYTRYFHVNLQSGELILLRPIDELINQTTTPLELHINITNDWIELKTIRIIIHMKNIQIRLPDFSQTDYYSSVSRTIPVGIEIARLTLVSSTPNCTYQIHSVERMKSQEFFHINSYSGSITILQSLENSANDKHLLRIISRCSSPSHVASTRLHIHILEKKSRTNIYRFSRENYLVIFETSLIPQQKKYLIDFQLINNEHPEKRIRPDAQISQGDPLGLFSIDSTNQSLVLLDESHARSYIYPLHLTIIDTSQKETLTCTVTIVISNIAIQFTCPPRNPSPYLFTYQSLPAHHVDRFTGQQYNSYHSITIHGYDPLTPSNPAECSIENSSIKHSSKHIDFLFDKPLYHHLYHPQEHIQLSIKNLDHYAEPFDITYQFLNQTNQHPFQIDSYTGLIKYIPIVNTQMIYSFLILAKYHSFMAFTQLKIIFDRPNESIDQFQIFRPLIDNYTIGYVKKTNRISSIFSIDHTGRLFLPNSSLIAPLRTSYEFLLDKSRIQIAIFSKDIIQCSLDRFNLLDDNQLLGFITTSHRWRKRAFYLLNSNHLFGLDRQQGLLYQRNADLIMENDLKLLIEIENARCILTISSTPYMIIREENDLDIQTQSSGQMILHNGTLINYHTISQYAPLFSRKSYTFSLNIPNHQSNRTIFVGQISAEAYHPNRSYLVYQFLSSTNHFIINPDNGIIEYISNGYFNKTLEQLQIIARDLIYQQNTTINLTIHIIQFEILPLSSLIYHQTISENLPPGSIIFEPNISSTQILHYSLRHSHSHLFIIDSTTGQITLLNYPSNSFYQLTIDLSPINQILIIHLTILDENNHAPMFSNLPLNLTIASDEIFVTKLSAYDLDLLDNRILKYYLLDRDQRKIFSINRTNGIITMKNPPNQVFLPLKIGVSDGLHLTINYLPITITNYSQNAPKFSAEEYIFQYQKLLGSILASDSDLNDRIIYQLHLQPDGIQIDPFSGLITIHTDLFFPVLQFFASASDRAQQLVYTKIKILFPIQPRFSSNLYHISLLPSVKIPSEIFRLHLVDAFNQPLSSARFEIDPPDFFQINGNKLILNEKLSSWKIFQGNITGYWKNSTCQTSIRIILTKKSIRLKKKFYEFSIEKNRLKDNYLIEKFSIKNSLLKILPTPLTTHDCTQNFALQDHQLHFRNSPILSNICFFELQLSYEKSISSSLIKISFIEPDSKPIFSSNIYYFYSNHLRIFAQSSNPIRYKLQANSYGLIINQTNGIVSLRNTFIRIPNLQLLVYAIDDKTSLNNTALIEIVSNEKNEWKLSPNIPLCPNTPIPISEQSLPGTIIQDLQNNHSNGYYILSGDTYGLFATDDLGKLYLASSMLNRTAEKFFELIILQSSSSISHCRTNISIIRRPQWSYFICPPFPIEWKIEEESPIGTCIGNVKDILSMINNNSQLFDQIQFKFNDTQIFHLNYSTGLLLSNARLDYEQTTVYSFSISLEPIELYCSLFIRIQLININDHSMNVDQKSLIYTINQTNLLPFYLGRIRLLNPDPVYSFQYRYYLKNSSSDISIDSTTGSIIVLSHLNRRIPTDQLLYEIFVMDISNQKTITDILRININEFPSFIIKSSNDHSIDLITLFYLFYPPINTIVYTIDIDPSNLTHRILNDTFTSYTLRSSSTSLEIILTKSILHNREDNIIIRFWNKTNLLSDIKLRLIYHQYHIKSSPLLSQTIDGYLNLQDTTSNINLGQLFLHNHSQYQFIYFHLPSNEHFSLQQISNNQTDLYFHSSPPSSFGKFRITLTAIGLIEPIPEIDFSKNTKIFLSPKTASHSIDIHLWPIDHEMIDRTVSLNLTINTTYEEFILNNLSTIRQTLARTIGVDIDHIHIYTFQLQGNQMELLLAVTNSISRHYLHRKFLYNTLKNTTNMSSHCQSDSCANHAYCISSIRLLANQYTYFYSHTYQHIIPKYQWNRTCLCQNSSYGDRCQYQQETISPCSSNPCLSTEKCLEGNSTSYTCQCVDASCQHKNSLNCININSPTCRDSSNTLTFDGYSFIRINSSIQMTEPLNITFSFRTHFSQGELLRFIYDKENSIMIYMIDGYLNIEFNEQNILQLNDVMINDGLWHDLDFLLDHSSYLLRLDHVFSSKITRLDSNDFLQFFIGTNYHGCLGNLSLNHQLISLTQSNHDNHSLELIGTTNGCQLPEIITDDLCSSYNPCYYGGLCLNQNEMKFICNCSNPRFTGRQCQFDLYPCASHPCSFDEQCLPYSSNTDQSFQCIRFSPTTHKSFYLGLILAISLGSLFLVLIYYSKKRKKHFRKDTPFVSAPLLIHRSSSTLTKPMDGTMQTLVRAEYHNMSHHQSYESVSRRSSNPHYSTIDQVYINSLSHFPEEMDLNTSESSSDCSLVNLHSSLINYNRMLTSTTSLPKTPIYARIVKTPKVKNMLHSTPTTFIRPIEINEVIINRLKHASDSDLLNERKSNKFSSFFQTDV